MWEHKKVDTEIWHSYPRWVSEPSLAKLKDSIKKTNPELMPLTHVGNNTFRSARTAGNRQWDFRFVGILSDYEAPSIEMTPDFTLDELEKAKSFIAKIS